VAGREALRLSPLDAAARGIGNGDVVRVFNRRGQCLAGAVLDDGVMAGVVCLPTGAWFDPLVPDEPASLELSGNPNVLTDDRPASQLSQAPAAGSCLVEVERWGTGPGDPPPPPSRAQEPPVFVPHPFPG
jgi:biotin/methionine sulfoxide reductase